MVTKFDWSTNVVLAETSTPDTVYEGLEVCTLDESNRVLAVWTCGYYDGRLKAAILDTTGDMLGMGEVATLAPATNDAPRMMGAVRYLGANRALCSFRSRTAQDGIETLYLIDTSGATPAVVATWTGAPASNYSGRNQLRRIPGTQKAVMLYWNGYSQMAVVVSTEGDTITLGTPAWLDTDYAQGHTTSDSYGLFLGANGGLVGPDGPYSQQTSHMHNRITVAGDTVTVPGNFTTIGGPDGDINAWISSTTEAGPDPASELLVALYQQGANGIPDYNAIGRGTYEGVRPELTDVRLATDFAIPTLTGKAPSIAKVRYSPRGIATALCGAWAPDGSNNYLPSIVYDAFGDLGDPVVVDWLPYLSAYPKAVDPNDSTRYALGVSSLTPVNNGLLIASIGTKNHLDSPLYFTYMVTEGNPALDGAQTGSRRRFLG